MDASFFQLVQEGPSQGEVSEARLPFKLTTTGSRADLPRLKASDTTLPWMNHYRASGISAYGDYTNVPDQYTSYNFDLLYRSSANLPFGLPDCGDIGESNGFTHMEHLFEAYPSTELLLHLGSDYHQTPTAFLTYRYVGIDNSGNITFCLEDSSERGPGDIKVPHTYKLTDPDGHFEHTFSPSIDLFIGEDSLIKKIREEGQQTSVDQAQLIDGYIQAFNEVLA